MKPSFSARLFSSLCILALGIILIPRLRAQQSQAPASVRVNARLVEVDVLVNDAHGQPITGLTQKDFSITDDGQPMQISFFSVLSPATPASAGQVAASSQAGANNIFTNAPSVHPNVPANLTIILVDALNTPFADMTYSTQQLIRYMSQLKPEEHVAIYTLGSQFRTLQDFTSDDSDLVAAIQGYKASNAAAPDSKDFLKQISATAASGSPNAAAVARIEKNLSNIDDPIPPQMRNTSVSITLAALRQIALHVAGVPGRKNLLWLSGGFPIDFGIKGMSLAGLTGADLGGESGAGNGLGMASGGSAFETMQPAVYLEQFQQTVRDLESANIALYPVDARGLVAQTAASDPRFANTQTGGPEDTAGDNIMTMDSIANRTGGRAFFNTNAIATSLSTAQNDAQYSYLIGYTPQTAWDGKFHKVEIKVSQPDAHVRARQGYFAMAPPKSAADERKLAIETAANSVLDSTQLPFLVQLTPKGSGGKTPTYEALMAINGSAIHFTPDGANYDAQLEFIIIQRDAAGNPIANSANKMSWAIPAAEYQAALDGMLTNTAKLTLDPSADEVRFIVRDPNSTEIGSVTVPIEKFPTAAAK